MAIEPNINMPKRFDLPSNPISRQILGRLGQGRWHRICVRGDREEGQVVVAEVEAFILSREVAEHGLREDQ